MNKWYRLDNAAKIFPSVSSKRRANVFRLSFELTEEIDPKILQEALNQTIGRFKSLKVRLKRGFFWYYLEENLDLPVVSEESPIICKRIKRKENNGYLFHVYYYKNRISLEMFHVLTDGTGALEFLKAITYNYLVLSGKELDSENLILTEIESSYEEFQDSYLKNYDNSATSAPRDVKALKIKGTHYDENWLSLIIGTLDAQKLKTVAKSYDATITEFLCACLIKTAIKTSYMFEKKKRPFQILVPVNLRKIFPSKTLRNFSLVISTKSFLRDELTFDDIIKIVKDDFAAGLAREYMHGQIIANVMIERNFFMRIVPLVLKEIVLRIGYKAWGDSINSMTISNLGMVDLPKAMSQYVEKAIFCNGSSHSVPVNVGVITHNNKLTICFNSSIIERDFQREFFRLLTSYDLPIVIETNELEV